MRHRPSRLTAGFSMVEILVVVAILTILMALATVASRSVINGRRTQNTLTTMGVLKAAITEYAQERPVEAGGVVFLTVPGSPPRNYGYKDFFGSWPPSPTVVTEQVPGTQPPDDDAAPLVWQRFNGLISLYPRSPTATVQEVRMWSPLNGPVVLSPPSPPPDLTTDYPSIECLVLFLRQFSPRAKELIDKLPEGETKKNLDRDSAVLDDGPAARPELIEIVDSWGHPLRYMVIPPNPALPVNDLVVRWELRSAGPDEAMNTLDDIVFTGP